MTKPFLKHCESQFKTWINKRLPAFPAPRNLNYFWSFGNISSFMLIVMMLSGIVLAMHYKADPQTAFDSVQNITDNVNYGWLIRNMHRTGASFLFMAVYIHMLRAIYYGSYKKPREMLWITGVFILLLMMATAFMGYVLPWGQMGYWAATVITNLFTSIPFIGEHITTMLLGGEQIGEATLSRFFVLHIILPFIICAVIRMHIKALKKSGANNPLGIDVKGPQDTLPFHPFYTIKDMLALAVFLTLYAVFVFYLPEILAHPENSIPADPQATPMHIMPEWYFLPFYAMLRAVTFNINIYALSGLFLLALLVIEFVWRHTPKWLGWKSGAALFLLAASLSIFGLLSDAYRQWEIPWTEYRYIPITATFGGVMAMFGSIALLTALPWLDTHPVRSARFRPWFRFFFVLLLIDIGILGFAGAQPADRIYLTLPFITLDNALLALAATGFYYAFFLIILPLLARYEKASKMPVSIHQAVLDQQKKGTVK
ncbi:MAG: cytochrome b [Alphaproteobacteria bacterium]